MMLQLDRTPGEVSGAHHDFLAAVADRLGSAHAAFFATPAPDGDGTLWIADGTDSRAPVDLDPAARAALHRYAGSILSDIRRVAERENGGIRRHFAVMRRIPSLDCLYAVDGRAVATRWGTAQGNDPIRALDDGRPAVTHRGFPGLPPRLLLSALAGTAAGFLVGTLMLRAVPPPPACAVATRPVDLPRQKWQSHDLSMLKGCWHRISNMKTVNIVTQASTAVQEWTFCFADDGTTGQQTLRYTNAGLCTSPIAAHFEGDTLVIAAERCIDQPHHNTFVQTVYRCTRDDDEKATCPGYTVDPLVPSPGPPGVGIFQRPGP
ncbi:hypothetical protein HLH26_19215 [Gluconacetobacter sp. 1b LMG 1731]|uniref:Uncharacterized protein n=1 Tax=Gluconacetobacter dulcium TaxID=2729096 RepID=A0A7W4IPC4_9PROT|nr:hypothetical protein [Gluconacetobacter dulcium]MBB2166615.1 hypothetical protein [Gluconacetobacter dulcium]